MKGFHGSAALLTFLATGAWVPACGNNPDPGDDTGSGDGNDELLIGDGDGDGDGDVMIDVPAANPSATACMSAADCDEGALCHPIANACVVPGDSCSTSSTCTGGTYCDPDSSSCLPGLPGSPCEGDINCTTGTECQGGTCACLGFVQEQESTSGPLDIYFIFDRTASMGNDCEYEPGEEAPISSKACFATYALADYLIDVDPAVNTRLAFQFMSHPDGCDGTPYADPLVNLTELPVTSEHPIIQEISDEEFQGGSGTQIEGALLGIAEFTSANETPGREMIGVLMTDGDPNGCDHDIENLAEIISTHLEETEIRTFIIGMDGATEENLETLAIAGGAEPHDDFCGSLDPPCHYWNVGDGSGAAILDALQAIAEQAVPFRCDYLLSEVEAVAGGDLDTKTLNVQLTQGGASTIIVNVEDEAACPTNQPAWFYDNNVAPTSLSLCETACDLVSSASAGATMSIVGGCSETVVLR